ncbi:hypothetical protein SJDPG11_00260 [Porphyromonas gingivalis SJD11]|nr:hypothetical protein SJDPG11_00260 [Porphyromonas gingivalis SJD11]
MEKGHEAHHAIMAAQTTGYDQLLLVYQIG